MLLQAETEVEQFIPPTAAATSFLVTSVISVANAALAPSGRALAGSQCGNKYQSLWGPTVASVKGQAGAWYQGKKGQLQRPKSTPPKKNEALGAGAGEARCLERVAELCSSAGWG